MTRTRGKKPLFEPGLIPAPGGLLNWRNARHFDRWQDLPCVLCDKPTPMQSHHGEPVHKTCASPGSPRTSLRHAWAGSPPTSSPSGGTTTTTPDPPVLPNFLKAPTTPGASTPVCMEGPLMATSALTGRPALTVGQAVALTLLRDGYTQRAIRTRTDVAPDELYRLAAVHRITAPHGTCEGHACHEARGEDPCGPCETAQARADSRARAQQRKKIPPALRSRLASGARRKAVVR